MAMVMGPPQYLELIEHDITQTIYNLDMAQRLSECALKCGKKAKVHIALETGMNRIGFKVKEESISDIKKIIDMDSLFIEGMFTHFSCADEKDKSYTKMQMKNYDDFLGMLEDNNIYIAIKHICNSAGIIEFHSHNFNSVGYAYGYMRGLSSKAKVLIHGQYAPIIGRICMDQMMVNVTNIEDVKIEDEVTLVGQDGENVITVEELAEIAGSFNYEFVCGIGKRVKRIYFS